MDDPSRFFRYLSEKPVLGLFLGISILSLGTALFKLPRVVGSSTWPTVEGVVVSSELGMDLDIGQYSGGWWPQVSYDYHVDGKDYTSSNIEVEDIGNGNTSSYAKQVVNRYPVGKEVQVHYAPHSPAIAVLEPGIPTNCGGGCSLMTIGLVVGVMGIGVISFFIGLVGILGVKIPRIQPTNDFVEGE